MLVCVIMDTKKIKQTESTHNNLEGHAAQDSHSVQPAAHDHTDTRTAATPLSGHVPHPAVPPAGISMHAAPQGQAQAPQSHNDTGIFQTNRKGFIEVVGEVIELLPAATFRVKLENSHEVRCHLSGRMRMHRIMLLPGDRVKVEMTPYDLTKGRITYRF